MSKDDILLEAEMSMEKSVDYMVHEFAAVRTGKASPGLVENVDVHAYGSTMKLKQLALITTPEARLLVVQPFDAGTVQDIEKALKESKIGIMPAVDGKIIRLPIPELSEERRKELVRSLSKMAEEARVRVRANRRAALDEAKKLKAAGELTEDGLRDVEDEVQKLTDRFVKSIDDHLKHKEAEILPLTLPPNLRLTCPFVRKKPRESTSRTVCDFLSNPFEGSMRHCYHASSYFPVRPRNFPRKSSARRRLDS